MIRNVFRGLVVLVLAATALLVPTAASADPGITVTGQFAFRSSGGVVLVGQYRCGPFASGVPDRGVFDLSVVQTVAGTEVRGIGYLTPTTCDGLPQWYAVELTTVGGAAFRRGPATWSASGYVEGDGGLQHFTNPPAPIRIR